MDAFLQQVQSQGLQAIESNNYMVGDKKYTIPVDRSEEFLNQVSKQSLEAKPVTWDWKPIEQEQPVPEALPPTNREVAYMEGVADMNKKLVGGDAVAPYGISDRKQYDPQAQEKSRERLSTIPVNPTTKEVEEAESARQELIKQNELEKGRYPVSAFLNNKEEYVDWYKSKLAEKASEVNPADYRDFYKRIDQEVSEKFLPEEYRAEYNAMNAFTAAVDNYLELEKSTDLDPKLREQIVDKAWRDAEKKRDALTEERIKSYQRVDDKIAELEQQKQDIISGKDKTWLDRVADYIPGSIVPKKPSDRTEDIADIDRQINLLRQSKKLVDLTPEEAVNEIGIGGGDDMTPEQKIEQYHKRVDDKIAELEQQKQDIISGKDKTWLDRVADYIPGSIVPKKPSDRTEDIADIDRQINLLRQSKKLVDLTPEEAVNEIGIGGGDDMTPEQKIEQYHKAIALGWLDSKDILKEDFVGGALEYMMGSDRAKGLAEVQQELSALTPLVLLRRIPMKDDGFGGVFTKSFLTSFNPLLAADLDVETEQQSMNRIQNVIEMAGAKVSDPNMGKAMDDIASPYEHYSSKDVAQMLGPTTAMMAQIMMSGPAFNQLMKIGKVGKFLEAGKKTGTLLGTDKAMTMLGNTKFGRGVVKAVYGGIEEGARFEVAGQMFGSDEELNFLAGMVGGIASYPLARIAETGGDKIIKKQLARFYGDKTEEAYKKVYELGERIKQGPKMIARGPAETLEEFGNEMGNIYRESDNWKQVLEKFEERFGDSSENLHFAISTAVMGWGFGAATNLGAVSLAESKKHYENLTEVEKSQFRQFMDEINGEYEEAANKISENLKAQDEKQDTGKAEAVADEQTPANGEATGEEVAGYTEQAADDVVEDDQGGDTEEGVTDQDTESFASKLGEVEDIGDVAEGQKKVRILDTDITLSEEGDTVTLEKIRTDEDARGKGSATEAMDALIEEADRQGKTIELTLDPEPGTDKERLRKFYEGFGFETYGVGKLSDKMVRNPEKTKDENKVDVQQQEEVVQPGVQSQAKVEQNNAEPVTDKAGKKVGSEPYMKGEHHVGRNKTITTPSGKKVKGRYKIVSAGDVLASHNEVTFGKTEGFPQNEDGSTVNDRDYETDKAAQSEVVNIANNLDGRAVQNTPVVTKQGIVVDGNNRTMSRKRAAKTGTDTEYINALKEDAEMYGFDPAVVDQVENPMLVFEAEEDMDMTTSTWSAFNKAEKKEKSPVERAVEIGKTISNRAVRKLGEIYGDADTASDVTKKASSVKAVKDLLLSEGVLDTKELPRYFSGNQFTAEGKAFMESLLIGSALSEEAVRSLDVDGMGNVRRRIVQALPQITQTAAKGDNSLVPEIEEAIELARKAKAAGRELGEFITQYDMFTDEKFSPGSFLVALSLDGSGFKDFLKGYNDTVGKPGLFGTETKEGLIDQALREKIDNYEQVSSNLRKPESGKQKESGTGNGQGDQFQESTEAKSEERSVVEQIVEKIESAFGKVFGTKVEIVSGETVGGNAGVAKSDGTIQLNEEKLNANTPIHEAGHLWNRWAKQNRSELYQEGLKKVKKSKYYYNVKNNPFYQEQAKDMTPEQREEFFLEEALATAIGDSGESFVTEARKKGFKDWLQSLWNSIAEFLGIEKMSLEEVEKMTLKEFADRVAASILSGQEIEGFVSGEFASQYQEKQGKLEQTMRDATSFEFVRERVNSNPYMYTVQSNEETVKKAMDWIEQKKDLSFVHEHLMKPETWSASSQDLAMINTAAFILADTYAQAHEKFVGVDDQVAAGFMEKWESIKAMVDKTSTNLGRAVQSYNIWKTMTPMGVAYYINKKIRAANEGERADYADRIAELEKELAEIKEDLDLAKQRVVEEVLKAKILQDQVDKLLKERVESVVKEKAGEVDESMGDEVDPKTKVVRGKKRHRVSKDRTEVKKEREKRDKLWSDFKSAGKKSASLSIIGINSEQLEILGKIATSYIKEGYYRTSEIVDMIIDQIKEDAPEVSPKDIETVVKGAIVSNKEAQDALNDNYDRLVKSKARQLKIKINDVVKKHYSERDPMMRTLTEKIVDEVGLSTEEAALVAQSVERLVQAAAKKYIDGKFKTKEKKPSVARETVLDVFVNSINNGALDNKAYLAKFAEHFNLIPELTPDQVSRIKELVKNLQDQEGQYYLEALRDLVSYMTELVPKGKGQQIIDALIGLNYAAILSGWSTHLVNVGSVQAAMRLQAFEDLANLESHFLSLKGALTKDGMEKLSVIPDAIYRNMAGMSGLVNGKQWNAFARVLKVGSTDNKWVEDVKSSSSPFGMYELERKKYGNERFKGGKWNPYNYAKYVGRMLEGEDQAMTTSLTDRYLAEEYRRILRKKGKKASVKDVTRLVNFDMLSEEQKRLANDQAANEAVLFRENTGRQLEKEVIRARRDEILRKMVSEEIGLSADEHAQLMDKVTEAAEISAFRGDRKGVISVLAGRLGNALNRRRWLKLASFPFVPFTKIVGNVTEYMLDGASFLGLIRAYGLPKYNWKLGKVDRWKPGSMIENEIAHRRQKGRAWLGTLSHLIFMWLFTLDEDDDPLEVPILITGPANYDGEFSNNPLYKPHTVYFNFGGKRLAFNYLNIPGLNVMLNSVGSLNDFILNEKTLSPSDKKSMLETIAKVGFTDQIDMVLNMSFLEGVRDMVDFGNRGMEALAGDPGSKRGADVKEDADVDNWLGALGRKAAQKYVPIVTNSLPWNANLVKQSLKLRDMTSYSRRTLEDILLYNTTSIFYSPNIRTDVFGDKVFSFPGEQFIAWEHYLTDKQEDENWKFLLEAQYIPEQPYNRSIKLPNDKGDIVSRKMHSDEYAFYLQRSGEYFKENVQEFRSRKSQSVIDRYKKEYIVDGNRRYTLLQQEVRDMYSSAKAKAKRDLLNALKKGQFEEEYQKVHDRLESQSSRKLTPSITKNNILDR